MWNSLGSLYRASLYSAGSYYVSIRRKIAAGRLVRDVRGNPPEDTTYALARQRLRTPNHCDFRLPFGMESHSLSAFPLPSAMEPDSQADFSFHSQWKQGSEPVSSFHLKWNPIPELLPAFHSQWIPNSEPHTPFHSQWIPHSALSVRSIHDGSRILLPYPACLTHGQLLLIVSR